MKIRIGHGYDVHKLVPNRKLIIGGVTIPHEMGLLGHSDADVLCHAIADAILGAAGKRDIGHHFPDSDPQYSGISSLFLLSKVEELIRNDGYIVGNIDCTIIAQAPKMSPYIVSMMENIAKTLNISKEDINIKATTEEKLGFTGRKEGISAHAVCIIEKK
jgi:2-C-methyl-D-erythritol 2,4-cyclodiphosphate synthase